MPGAKKFKSCGIDPDLEEKLDDMFTGVVATGTYAFTLSEQGFGSFADEMETVQLGDSEGGPSQVHNDVQSTSASKRPKLEKKKKGVAFIKETIDELLESCKVRPVSSIDSSIEECIKILDAYPDVTADTELYVNYLKLLRDPTIRHFFIKLDPKYRLPYLRTYMDA